MSDQFIIKTPNTLYIILFYINHVFKGYSQFNDIYWTPYPHHACFFTDEQEAKRRYEYLCKVHKDSPELTLAIKEYKSMGDESDGPV